MNITTRFSEIVDNFNECVYHILGCGAIGSSAALQLVRMGAEEFLIYDFDKVSEENIGVSQYNIPDIKQYKVEALKKHMLNINPDANVSAMPCRFDVFEYTGREKNVMILAFDNMDSRLEAVEKALKTNHKPWLLIDGRMGAEHYQQYTLINPELKDYKKTWYSDEDGDPEPCNAKATAYCSNMSGSFIANHVRKALTGQHINKEFFFNFPTLTLARGDK
jgi:molybdopterin/thiamine biosynthesis adenylyltransferase